jgi:hypothetical protein
MILVCVMEFPGQTEQGGKLIVFFCVGGRILTKGFLKTLLILPHFLALFKTLPNRP